MLRSVQQPEAQYRAGLVVYLNAAKAGLWDPHWRSQFKPIQLKRLDAAWRAAGDAISEEMKEKLPDLEGDGEYELPEAEKEGGASLRT